MRFFPFLFSFALLTTASSGQNIVPNYSFEQVDFCPTGLNITPAKYSLGCIAWGQATSATADYYNACDTASTSVGKQYPAAGVPNNNLGYQVAYDGVAYAGIGIYDSALPDYKEYLIASIPALDVDTMYKVSIEVSLADNSTFATDGLGVFFTSYGSPRQYGTVTLFETPQVDYTSFGIISDTINWTTLSGVFKADSAYTNIIIGCFKDKTTMNISKFNTGTTSISPYFAYYYIDNVVVEKLSSTGVTNVNNSLGINVYPNPFEDYTTLAINNSANIKYSFSLFNMQGQIVQHVDVVTDKLRIERNGLPPGFYYYQVRNANNIAANGKLIIR